MPKFPISLASGDVPSHVPYGQPSPGYWAAPAVALGRFGEEIGYSGEVVQNVQHKLQQENDEMEAISLTSEYDNRLAALKSEVQLTTDPLQHEMLFTQRAQELTEQLGQKTTSGVVRSVLTKHALRRFSQELSGVRKESRVLFDQKQLAWLDRMEEDYSTKAASAPTEAERAEATVLYEGVLARFEQRGLLDPVKAQNMRQRFTQKTTEKQMKAIARTNPQKLYQMDLDGAFNALDMDTRTRILELARKQEDHAQVLRDRQFSEAKEAVDHSATAQANFGQLTDAFLNSALKGENPYITPDRARTLKAINDNPPTGEADTAVTALMQEYALQPLSLRNITTYRAALTRLSDELGKPSKAIETAGFKLSSDERALRSVNAAELSANIKAAEDDYAVQTPPKMPGRIGQMQENQSKVDRAIIRAKIRGGAKPDKAVDDVVKQREAERNAIPNKHKGIMDLVE